MIKLEILNPHFSSFIFLANDENYRKDNVIGKLIIASHTFSKELSFQVLMSFLEVPFKENVFMFLKAMKERFTFILVFTLFSF